MPAIKPIERKRLNGRTPTTDSGGRKLPAVREVIVKTTGTPAPPPGLGARGAAEWASIWRAGSAWLAPAQDYAWVEIVARAWDDIEGFRAKVQADGLIQKGSMGQVIAHPLIASIRQAEAQIMKALSVLGFSPTDRARLGLAEIKRVSKLQEMMSKGQ
jgi:P27 family predicted phage terminase small subunit